MPLDLSEVAEDAEMGRNFTVLRNTGKFAPGGWQTISTCSICAWGIFAIATPKALRMVPEGDRVEGSIQIITAQPMYTTNEKRSGTSDQVQFEGNMYRVQSVEPWKIDGFFSAILVRMTGS